MKNNIVNLTATLRDKATFGVDEDNKPISIKVPYAVAMPDVSESASWLEAHAKNFDTERDFMETVNRFCDAHFSKGFARTDLLKEIEEQVEAKYADNADATSEEKQEFARKLASMIAADADNAYTPAPRGSTSAPIQVDMEAAAGVLAKLKAGQTTIEKIQKVCSKFVTLSDAPTQEDIAVYFKKKRLDANNTSEF